MRIFGKRSVNSILLLFCLLFLSGCSAGEAQEGTPLELYYLNREETRVTMEKVYLQSQGTDDQVKEVLELLSETPDNLSNRAPVSGSVNLLEYRLEEGQLVLKFDEHYKELPATTEVLTRAALVRSLTQIEGVDFVAMQIREEALLDAVGSPVGVMSGDMFIDNVGEEINAYEKIKLRLYFADESGTGLIEAVRPYVYNYNSNVSMERLVLEQLIVGPNNDELYPTMNPDTKVLGTTVKDGVCYVNLDETFLTQIYSVSAEVTIYAIVNSLVELPNINKVQMQINGESDITYRENLSFTTLFERNLELVGNS